MNAAEVNAYVLAIRENCNDAVALFREEIAQKSSGDGKDLRDRRFAPSDLQLIGLAEQLGLQGVFNTMANHTTLVLNLEWGGYDFALTRYNPNDRYLTSYPREIDPKYLLPTFEIAEKAKGDLVSYLSESYYPASQLQKETIRILERVGKLNGYRDCGLVCAYMLWSIKELENGRMPSAKNLENHLVG